MISPYFRKTFASVLLGFSVVSVFVSAKEIPIIDSAFVSTTLKITAMPDAVNVPIEWQFTNHWDNPLIVERFEESCGCLSAQSKIDITTAVEPGKNGVIRAHFSAGQLRGLVRKSLHVRFVGHSKPIELIVEARIPKTVELSANDLVWNTDSKRMSKCIDVTAGTGVDFSIKSLTGVSEEQFEITSETLIPKRHYRLTILPKAAHTSGPHTLIIRTDSPDPRDQVLAVFLLNSQEITGKLLTNSNTSLTTPKPAP